MTINPKKKTLLVLSLALVALASCGGESSAQPGSSAQQSASQPSTSQQSSAPSGKTINLYRDSSRLIGTPKPNPQNPSQMLPMTEANLQFGKLPTYRHKDKGDVPYVAVPDLAKAIGDAFPNVLKPGMSGEKKDDGYHLYSADKRGELILDAAKDVIKSKNSTAFAAPVFTDNNGIAGDYCAYRGNSIKESPKTKVYKEDGAAVAEYDVFDFGKYNFDIVEQEGAFYVPLEAFTKVLFRDVSLDLAYNGADFYSSVSESSFLASWVYSSKGVFQGLSGIYEPSKSKGTSEAYRFESPTKRLKEGTTDVFEDYTRFLVLMEGGSGYSSLCQGKELNPSNAVSDVESEYQYSWRKVGENILVDVADSQGPLGTLSIHMDETRFLSGTISKELSAYNYDILRFLFDTVYGLKEIKNYTDATAYFKAAGVDEGLRSNNPGTYTEAFSKLIGYVDDGHSGFNNMTPCSSPADLDKIGDYQKASKSGARLKALQEASSKYMKARMAKTKELDPDGANPDEPNYYQGIKFSSDKSTAVISFNGFANNADTIKNMGELFPEPYNIEESEYNILTRAKLISSTPDGWSQAFKVLDLMNKNTKVVQNVVIDLTTNGGGEIAIMPYLAAFFSDDPTYVIKDVTNGVTREYHYQVDLNGDGKFGQPDDTYKGKYNFYFLTSGFSFSCGNCLPGMAKEAGAKIIGETSGGGTSPVGVFFDGIGTYFNLSNHYDMCYKSGEKYVHNDAGIPLDAAFPFENGNWYDVNAVDTFIKTLK